jgi:lysozyme
VTAPAKGVDVSSWQHPNNEPIDWEAVAKAGFTFAIVKATQGDSYTNPWLRRDYDDAFAAGLLVGVYHFYDSTVEATKQAEHFVGSLVGMRLDVNPWLDLEVTAPNEWTLAGYCNTFLEAARDGRPSTGLYCSQATWAELQKASVNVSPVWAADWGVDTAPPEATIWQKGQGDVPGITGPVDLDYIVKTRGLNLPTTPPAKPSAATVHAPEVKNDPEPEPADDDGESA